MELVYCLTEEMIVDFLRSHYKEPCSDMIMGHMDVQHTFQELSSPKERVEERMDKDQGDKQTEGSNE